jgi:nitrogen fixation/metabolism regulation signal transduction histidine kinase
LTLFLCGRNVPILLIAWQKHIDFRFSHNNEKLSVFVDAKKFDSVVFNVLSNALIY